MSVLFDPYDPDLVGDAVARARRQANPDWYLSAVRAARRVAADSLYFTTDEVWEVLKTLTTEATPEHRAMGAVMRSLAHDRIATRTDRTRPTRRPCANSRPISIWRSLIRPA
jgi:hypothetical protein